MASSFDTAAAFLQSPGEMAARITAFDWSTTSLGPLDGWGQSLKTIVAFLVRSSTPVVLLWGTDGVMIYNDGFSVFAGGRHPEQLGMKVLDRWPEVAAVNANVVEVGLRGESLTYFDQELTLYRSGRAEQVWMNLDYTPVLDDDGRPGGVICLVVETSARVLADRRQAAEQERQALLDRGTLARSEQGGGLA